MRFEELNWFDVESYLEKDDRLMLVIGSCEQHAHLSLLTDVKIPQALADAASKQTGVPVAPPLNFGPSPYFTAYPGTLSLKVKTFLNVIGDLVHSVHRQGFRRLLFLNGHGGNEPARVRLSELANQLSALRVEWYSWWKSHSVEDAARKLDLKPGHGNWMEAFPFTRVAPLPEKKKNPPHVPGIISTERLKDFYGDGSFGGEYAVESEIMDEIFQAALEDVLNKLKFLA